MKRANLEGASLKNCKFEASSNINTTANLEGILILIFVLTHFVSLDSFYIPEIVRKPLGL